MVGIGQPPALKIFTPPPFPPPPPPPHNPPPSVPLVRSTSTKRSDVTFWSFFFFSSWAIVDSGIDAKHHELRRARSWTPPFPFFFLFFPHVSENIPEAITLPRFSFPFSFSPFKYAGVPPGAELVGVRKVSDRPSSFFLFFLFSLPFFFRREGAVLFLLRRSSRGVVRGRSRLSLVRYIFRSPFFLLPPVATFTFYASRDGPPREAFFFFSLS